MGTNRRCSSVQTGWLGGNSTVVPNGVMGVGLGSLSLLGQAERSNALANSFGYCLERDVFFRGVKVSFGCVMYNQRTNTTNILRVREPNSNARYCTQGYCQGLCLE